MERVIDNFGTDLEQFVKSNNYTEAGKLITNVTTGLDDNIGRSRLNYMVSKIFDESYRLPRFLVSIKDRKEWKFVLSKGLTLLERFLLNFLSTLKPYIREILETCKSVATSRASAFEKCQALDILCLILDHDCDIPLDDVRAIYLKFYDFIRVQQSSTATNVQRDILNLLGIVSKKYPFVIDNQTDLLELYLRQLKRQSEMSEDKRDKYIIIGCVNGMSHMLETISIESDDIRTRIYGSIKKLLESKIGTKELRGVLDFVSKHCVILAEQMYNDSPEWWNSKLTEWTGESGENQKAGYVALNAFYAELATVLQTKTDERDTRIFQHFFDDFLNTLRNDNAQMVQARLAICGFGKFAAPCKVHLSMEHLAQMFIIIVNRMAQDYFVQDDPSVEQLEYLPDYMQCFAEILHHIGAYTFDQIDSLQQISVLMVKSFPRLSAIYHSAVFDSLFLTMCYLYQFSAASLKNYLERVVFQSVLWTCSHRTTFDVDLAEEVEQEEENSKKSRTYRNYLPLWKNLLSRGKVSNAKVKHIPLEVQESVVRHLYNELIKTLLLLVNKLNLSTQSKLSEDEPIVDPQTAFKAENIDDFVIFINVVDFYAQVLTFAEVKLFARCTDMYNGQIIAKSIKYPLVSGFYKLLRLSLELSDKLQYFSEVSLQQDDRRATYIELCSYLEGVSCKVQEFKDDLQVSCLQLLLAVPVIFVEPLLPVMGPVFHMVFTIGRGYLKLAESAVDTLEKWYRFVPAERLKPLFKEILPYLDPYLRSKGYTGDPDIKISLLQRRKTKRSKAKGRVYIESDGELSRLQHKILMFVGQLNSEMCLYLVATDVHVDSVTWEKEPHLKFTVPYGDVKPNIYLDKIIPRVVELALSSGDQKTRITACELLHASVIFMLGTTRSMSPTKSKQLSKLFERLILPLIQLGCDSHDVIRQLFHPLVFQLVHWYSSPMQMMSSETEILVNTLMEGISHPTDTAVRDLSGKCIREFVVWTIKQSGKDDLERHSANIKSIVRQICQYCAHPNALKRLGAALAFNNLYVHLREEQSMVDMYWIELLYWLLINMSLVDASTRSKMPRNTQIDQSIKHIERVLREKSILFNRDSKKRRIPAAIKGNLLKDVVLWILQQTASMNLVYRRKCIALFTSLAPYCHNCGTTKEFVRKFVETSNDTWFYDLYEADGIHKMATLNDFQSSCATTDVLMKWLQYLLRCLDAYTYLLDYNIIANEKLSEQSKINISLRYYMENISTCNLQDCMALFQHPDKNEVYLTEDIEEFIEMKRSIVIGILDYLLSVIEKDPTSCAALQTDAYKNFFTNCVFEPCSLGFETTSKENAEKLSLKLTELFNKFSKKLPTSVLDDLCTGFWKYFLRKYDVNVFGNSIRVPAVQRYLLKGLLLLLKSELKEHVPNRSEYFVDAMKSITDNLVKVSDGRKVGVELQSTVKEYAELKLTLAFEISDQMCNLCDRLANKEPIKTAETISTMPFGEFFLNSFKDTIMNYTAGHATGVVKNLCVRWQGCEDNNCLQIVMKILKFLSEDKQLKKRISDCDLTGDILSCCANVFKCSPDMTMKTRNFQMEFMTRVAGFEGKRAYIIGDRYPFFKTWFIQQLNYEPTDIAPRNLLHFKISILSFLHCVTGPDEDSNEILQSALSSFHNNLLGQSRKQIENSERMVLFKKLLDYLIISRSRIVLTCVVDIFTTIKFDDKDINIDRSLQTYMEAIDHDAQYKSLCTVYLLCSANPYSADSKYKLAKMILTTLLRLCKYEAFEEFFVEYITEILAKLRLDIGNNCDANLLVNKSIHFMLIDSLFSRIKVAGFADKSCRITRAAFEVVSSGKELLIEAMRIAKLVRKENCEFTEAELKECYRLYHCNAFNAIVSILSNSKKSPEDINIYCYLFTETAAKNEFIWKHMIDCSKLITVPQDFDILPMRKKVFVNIRNENHVKSARKVRYIESQNLFNSTLSEDVCKFDFTNTLVRNVDLERRDASVDEHLANIVIECVDVNNHECMATVCGLIRHLVDTGISPLPKSEDKVKLPRWLRMIQSLMLDATTLVNVKMFFARVIHNMKRIFRHYAGAFFEPVAKFIVDNCAGNNINYLVADLVEMLVTWSQDITLDDIKMPATQLVHFLMENAHNDRRDMFKYNLTIVKTVVEAWKTVITVPYNVIRDKLSATSAEKLVGIHLTGILLANDLAPWTEDTIKDITKGLTDILLKDDTVALYKPAAEVIGMLLREMSTTGHPEFKLLSVSTETALNASKAAKLCNAVEQIQMHYPAIIDKYIQNIWFKIFNGKEAALQSICLRNILRRFEHMEFRPLTTKDYISFLGSTDRDVRLLTLQIVLKSVPELSKTNIGPVAAAVCDHKLDSNGMIRCAVYDVLIAIYQKYNVAKETESKELVAMCKSVLLAGLVDSDAELQEKMLLFWCGDEQDSPKLADRFIKSLTDLYSPDTELFYLGCANYFLLEACKHTPEYEKLMFEHPLSDCKFDDYQMLINWRARNATMAPLFASTMETQFRSEDHGFPEMFGVRATASPKAFAPTASVLDLSASLNPTSSFLFEARPTPVSRATRIEDNVDESHEDRVSYSQHSRRFLSDKQKISQSFAKREVDKKERILVLKKERVQRNDANVVMYRQYRKGELPDVQIPYSAILLPLKMLARQRVCYFCRQRDGVLARQLYVMLFSGLVTEMSETSEFLGQFNTSIVSVFNQSSMYVPNVIGAFLDIVLENNKIRGRRKIHVEPEVLAAVCKNSGLLPVGCLLLEDVIQSRDEMPTSSKRGCGNTNDTVNQWVKLADMYKELNEWDAVIGIFSSKHMDCSDDVLSAIHAESNGQWREALRKYERIIETDTNFNRKDFYYDSYFKCYANLSEWECIANDDNLKTDTLWDGDWHQENMLPWYMTAQVCMVLERNAKATILGDLDQWMKDKEKSEYLKDKFSEELAMLALYKNDLNASRHYVENCFAKFLENWSHLNPLFSKIRSSGLLNFQKIIDLNKYVSAHDNNFSGMLNYWQENSDFTCSSVNISEIRTLYRQQILTSYQHKVEQLNTDDLGEQKLLLKELKVTIDINLISSSLAKHNHFVARKYCKKNASYMKSRILSVEGFKLGIAAGKIGTIVAENYTGSQKVARLIDSWKKLDPLSKHSTYKDLQIEAAQQIFVITQNIFDVLDDNTDLVSSYREKLVSLTGSDVDSAFDVQIYGSRKLGSTIEGDIASGNCKIVNNLIKAYLSLTVFAQNQQNSNDYSADIVKYVLRAMRLGSKEARQLFPCLLQMPALADEITDVFKAESSTVPTWMFLAWIPQLLAILDTPIAHATADVIMRIASAYPQALVYAYRLSKEKYNLQNGSEFFKDLINKLDDLLHNELIDKLIAELSCVCFPQLYINYHVERMIKYASNYKSVKEKIASFTSDFKTKRKSSDHFKVIDVSVKRLEDIINRSSDWDEIKKSLFQLRTEIAATLKNKPYTKLKVCSPWLANFQASGQQQELEIPGQYSGDRKPLLKYHAKVSSFRSDIFCVMSSLRKPIKIVIFGNDSREYPFLLKFGEDLRQDQRIQQLLSLANSILQNDLQCQQRNLSVERFEVTPLTTSLGLIKWVDGTKALGKFIHETAEDQANLHRYTVVRDQYHKWIFRASKGATCSDPVRYHNALVSYSQNETIQKFTGFVSEIPADILSKAFWQISMDTESYTSLRHQFITSYATMCLVHWLFGIGDRNLGNCLILQNTGRAVGIDFGLTFGAGTQNLPIPELIPFRLTPHILQMMEPLRETGFIDRTMIHCLRALRKQKHILASAMSVFINEPSVDWLEYARSQQTIDDAAQTSSGSWYPNRKVALARRKLDGANPAAITVEELTDGCVRDAQVRKAYIELIKGDTGSVRARMAQEGLTEEEQVQCLLDQATDYNILGRMYAGLELWI